MVKSALIIDQPILLLNLSVPIFVLAGQIQPEQSMFAIHRDRAVGRKRRQVTEPNLDFIFPDPPVPFSIENLNYTDEQREFCNNISECMFDLLLTEDTEIAGNTMEANIEGTRQEIELGRCKTTQSVSVSLTCM